MPPKSNRLPARTGRTVSGFVNNKHLQSTTNSSAHAIAEALALKRSGNTSWQGNCPACGYANGFSLSEQEGKPLWYCHACGDGKAIQHCLNAQGLIGGSKMPFAAVRLVRQRPLHDKIGKSRVQPFVEQLWAASQPIAGTAAAAYLARRGLRGPYPEAVRFLSSCKHVPTATACPAMIAAVKRWPDSQLVAIHRTYLKPDGSGKIDHPQARMMLGDARGGAVQLGEVSEIVAIGEGIETALSVQQVYGIPTWACLSTSGLQAIILPDAAREVIICADNDAGGQGQRAAYAAAERLTRQGRQVKIVTPPQADTDFNDMLKGPSHE